MAGAISSSSRKFHQPTTAFSTNKLNQQDMSYPLEYTIPDMFYQAVKKWPSSIAISSDFGRLTYTQLNERSNQVAHMLVQNGLKKGDFVAIFMERSLEIVISLLGILKAGGVYVPIDPSYPQERCRYLLEDSQAAFILTKAKFSSKLDELLDSEAERKVFCIDTEMNQYPRANIATNLASTDLAYIIYTSGSTGKPKGAMIPHRGVINYFFSIRDIYDCTEHDVYTQFFSFSFDPSVAETFMSLFTGSRLHIVNDIERVSIEAFADVVEREKVTNIILPTAFFNQIAMYLSENDVPKFKTVKNVGMGGEMLIGSMVRQWQQKLGAGIGIINLYGPTETTIVATTNKVTEYISEDVTSIPIGLPLKNYEAYILNPAGQLCPVNVPGELCIGGPGLAQGYLHKPEKTAEVFVPNPFSHQPNDYMYRTGDIVRLLPNGLIDYIGRKDNQVKVRGYRIEIGEIEDVLARKPDINEVAIIAKRLEDGNNTLIAYYTTVNRIEVDQDDIRTYLGNQLPSYMIPDRFIPLEEMPFSPTGKIDRKKLAAREEKTLVNSRKIVGPENKNQQILIEAWKKVLGLDELSIHDDFFHVGGHSLKILQILVLVKKHFPLLKIQDFFQHRTIAQLDQHIQTVSYTQVVDSQDNKTLFKIKDLVEPKAFRSYDDNSIKEMKAVLLTGATGYFGSHILYELIQKTNAHIYTLIRSNTENTADQRLKETIQFYFGTHILNSVHHRVTVIEGDLSRKDLNLKMEDRLRLKNIDTIIHCGADVRHFGDHTHFQDVNVEGTRYLLNIARERAGKIHFHHVSTLGISEDLALLNGQWDYFSKHGDFDYNVTLDNVYTNSKLQAEMVVKEAAIHDDIPVTIYRVGNLTCHSKTGLFQKNIDANAFYRMIKAMLYLGKAPKAKWYVDLTPIDFASQALVTLATQPNTNGQVFHLCNPKQIPYERFVELIRNQGYEIELMDQEAYQEWLFSVDHPEELREYLSLAIAQLEGDGAKDSEYRFSCSKTEKYLQRTGVHCPEPDLNLVQKLLRHGLEKGYFPESKLTMMLS